MSVKSGLMGRLLPFLKVQFILLFICFNVKGQEQQTVLGANVSGIEFKEYLNSANSYTTLSEYKGKAVILDFWATWCGSCLAAMPKMEVLQKEFESDLRFLLISAEEKSKVESFLAKVKKTRAFTLPVVLDKEGLLNSRFNVKFLPHYVWIDKNGVLKAVTNQEEVTRENIQALISETLHISSRKEEQRVSNAGMDHLSPLYQSVISTYEEGKGSSFFIGSAEKNDGTGKISATNCTVSMLYRIAHTDKNTLQPLENWKCLIESKDSLLLTLPSARLWDSLKTAKTYSYSLVLPGAGIEKLTSVMKEDLGRFFPYAVSFENRPVSCLVLSSIGSGPIPSMKQEAKLEQNFFGARLERQPISKLIEVLSSYNSKGILDETALKFPIDIELRAELNNLAEVNKQLHQYHLQLTPAIRELRILVIKDKSNQQP